MIPKFRAFLIEAKTMHNVLAIDFSRNMYCLQIGKATIGEWFWFREIELMQSTGLKDKNGVEIFEGDVVSLTEGECSYSGIVVRDYYEFYIKGIGSRDCFDFQDVSNTFDGTTSLEVTTNIYKNPELLEQANEN